MGVPTGLRREGTDKFGPSFSDPLALANKQTAIFLENDKIRELKNQIKMVVQDQKPVSKADVIDKVIYTIGKKKKLIDFLIKK